MATATTTARAPNVPEAGSFEAEEQQLHEQQQVQEKTEKKNKKQRAQPRG